MASTTKFRNLICMADLFFALSASLFLLSAIEGKTLEGEDPLVDRDPNPAEIEKAIGRLEAEADTVQTQLEAIENLSDQLGLETPESRQP
ncbi:hypothetical protein [Synoicihabitans lomoniglobus]|uniref:Uncharacterized protein n=1 Tax=Synoicihabitans lomoniglobus TaxID=2909285 RepID=A0AAE9ZWX8_9BACT|nr:hypothetical protein [Opitutaceae bacterium LMO-M01]WED65667.1 hypothetical protein PXH66_02250 [Opitutaceae bacterium LMO-M01]